ncbi:unnamed protein product [Choristocarpus tenellus]
MCARNGVFQWTDLCKLSQNTYNICVIHFFDHILQILDKSYPIHMLLCSPILTLISPSLLSYGWSPLDVCRAETETALAGKLSEFLSGRDTFFDTLPSPQAATIDDTTTFTTRRSETCDGVAMPEDPPILTAPLTNGVRLGAGIEGTGGAAATGVAAPKDYRIMPESVVLTGCKRPIPPDEPGHSGRGDYDIPPAQPCVRGYPPPPSFPVTQNPGLEVTTGPGPKPSNSRNEGSVLHVLGQEGKNMRDWSGNDQEGREEGGELTCDPVSIRGKRHQQSSVRHNYSLIQHQETIGAASARGGVDSGRMMDATHRGPPCCGKAGAKGGRFPMLTPPTEVRDGVGSVVDHGSGTSSGGSACSTMTPSPGLVGSHTCPDIGTGIKDRRQDDRGVEEGRQVSTSLQIKGEHTEKGGPMGIDPTGSSSQTSLSPGVNQVGVDDKGVERKERYRQLETSGRGDQLMQDIEEDPPVQGTGGSHRSRQMEERLIQGTGLPPLFSPPVASPAPPSTQMSPESENSMDGKGTFGVEGDQRGGEGVGEGVGESDSVGEEDKEEEDSELTEREDDLRRYS